MEVDGGSGREAVRAIMDGANRPRRRRRRTGIVFPRALLVALVAILASGILGAIVALALAWIG